MNVGLQSGKEQNDERKYLGYVCVIIQDMNGIWWDISVTLT